MALNDTKTSAATELADGNSSAATEHTEEPQLAEIVNQEAGSSTAIELKVVRNDLVDYTYTWKGEQIPTRRRTLSCRCRGLQPSQARPKKTDKGNSRAWLDFRISRRGLLA